MGKDPRPAVIEEGRRLGYGADLAEGAGGPERGIPGCRVTRRRAIVRAHVKVRIGDVVIAG